MKWGQYVSQESLNKEQLRDAYFLAVLSDLNLSKPIEIIKALLNQGANPNSKTKDGIPAIYLALNHKKSSLKILTLLLENGADPNVKKNHDTILSQICNQPENYTETKKLISILSKFRVDLNSKDIAGDTPFIQIIQKSSLLCRMELLKCLLENGADPFIKGYMGLTALHYLCMMYKEEHCFPEQEELLKLLLERGGNPSCRSKYNSEKYFQTPLALGYQNLIISADMFKLMLIMAWAKKTDLDMPALEKLYQKYKYSDKYSDKNRIVDKFKEDPFSLLSGEWIGQNHAYFDKNVKKEIQSLLLWNRRKNIEQKPRIPKFVCIEICKFLLFDRPVLKSSKDTVKQMRLTNHK